MRWAPSTIPKERRICAMANKTCNQALKPYAQTLRREMTREERHLWYDFLKSLPITVKRQHIIGSYIVDFYIASAKLVIELDGSQHYEETAAALDRERDAFLRDLGITVYRYSNKDINQRVRNVCEDILLHIEKHH